MGSIPTPGTQHILNFQLFMDNRPIGVIDSGLGGLSVWQAIVEKLPHESTIYLADSKNCPYGTKTEEEIYSLAKRLGSFMLAKDVKLIVLACNTITVTSLEKLRKDFPNIPFIGIVPVIKTAAKQSKSKRIGILSTKVTAESPYQQSLIARFANDCQVTVVGTEKLVPFVESGNHHLSKQVVEEELMPFIKAGVDTIALGCSHFPFLKDKIQEVIGKNVLLLDSSGAIARQVERVLQANQAFSDGRAVHAAFYTTGDSEHFRTTAIKLFPSCISLLQNTFKAGV